MKPKAKIYQFIVITGIIFLILLAILAIEENKKIISLRKIFSQDNKQSYGTIVEYNLSATEEDNVIGRLNTETLELVISGYGKMKDYKYDETGTSDMIDHFNQGENEYHWKIKKIIIEEGIENIGSWMFASMSELEEVEVPNSITRIGKRAFSGTNLYKWNGSETVVLPSGIDKIEEGTFDYCRFKSVVIPSNVKDIQRGAFYDCRDLENVYIENGVKRIGAQAFGYCNSLESIDIPWSINEIAVNAFTTSRKLKSINVDEGNSYYKSIYGILFSKDETVLVSYPSYKPGTSYTVPSTVTTIGARATTENNNLISITIPANVTYIEQLSDDTTENYNAGLRTLSVF